MSITGPGSITAANVLAQTNMMNSAEHAGSGIGSGQAAQTYSGLQSQAGVALWLNAQLSAITGYSNTATTVGTTLSVAQSVLTQLGTAGSSASRRSTSKLHSSSTITARRRPRPSAASAARQYSVAAQYAGRQQLHFFRQCAEPAVGRQRVGHSQRQWRAGRTDPGDLGAAAGRPRRQRSRTFERRYRRRGFYGDAQSGRHTIRLSAYRRGFQL